MIIFYEKYFLDYKKGIKSYLHNTKMKMLAIFYEYYIEYV